MIKNRNCDTTDTKPISINNQLIMTIGLPSSGKSSWAIQQGFPVVCLDAIRLAKTGSRWWGPMEHEIWATARTMVRALFLAGHKTIIVDDNFLLKEQREYFISDIDIQWNRWMQIIDTDANTCENRAIDTYPELVPVIRWFHNNRELVHNEDIKLYGLIKNGEVIVPCLAL
jgi:predicted kinase